MDTYKVLEDIGKYLKIEGLSISTIDGEEPRFNFNPSKLELMFPIDMEEYLRKSEISGSKVNEYENDIIKSLGLECSTYNRILYIMLHEYGHAHDCLVEHEGNYKEYCNYHMDACNSYQDLMDNRTLEDRIDDYFYVNAYRSMNTERYADSFARNNIVDVLAYLDSISIANAESIA